MDALQFTAVIVGHITWSVAVVTIAILLCREIKVVLLRLGWLKVPGVEAKLFSNEGELQDAVREVASPQDGDGFSGM